MMNQVGAIKTGGNADLAAGGINLLSSESLGADFALLLGQMSQNGSTGVGGALASQSLRDGRTSFASSAMSGSGRSQRKRSGSSIEQSMDALDSASDSRSQRVERGGSGRADGPEKAGRDDSRTERKEASRADRRREEASGEEDAGSVEEARMADDAGEAQAAEADPEAEEASDAQAGAEAVEEAGASEPLDPLSQQPGEAADPQEAVSAAAMAPVQEGAAAGQPAAEGESLGEGASGSGADPQSKAVLSAQSSAEKGGAQLQDGVQVQEEPDAKTMEALSQDPVEAKQVSDRSAAMGELFEEAGVTKVTVTEDAGASQAQSAKEASDTLSSIADSVKAASELFPEQEASDGHSGGSGSEGRSSDGSARQNSGVDGALMVLRQNSQAAEGADGAAAEGGDPAATGKVGSLGDALELLSGGSARGAAAADGTQAAAAASPLGGTSGLSQSRLESHEAMASQSLRDTMLSLSSDVKRNAEKITEAVMAMSSRNLKSLNFELNPEGLGSMQITIDSDQNGDAVKIAISASSSQARGILAQGMDALRDGLLRNGIFAQAELEGGDAGSQPQDGGQGAWQDQGSWQGSGRDGSESAERQWNGGTLFASGSDDGADAASAPAADPAAFQEDGLNLFA
jgi:flagellar hook-length control protein FliK